MRQLHAAGKVSGGRKEPTRKAAKDRIVQKAEKVLEEIALNPEVSPAQRVNAAKAIYSNRRARGASEPDPVFDFFLLELPTLEQFEAELAATPPEDQTAFLLDMLSVGLACDRETFEPFIRERLGEDLLARLDIPNAITIATRRGSYAFRVSGEEEGREIIARERPARLKRRLEIRRELREGVAS